MICVPGLAVPLNTGSGASDGIDLLSNRFAGAAVGSSGPNPLAKLLSASKVKNRSCVSVGSSNPPVSPGSSGLLPFGSLPLSESSVTSPIGAPLASVIGLPLLSRGTPPPVAWLTSVVEPSPAASTKTRSSTTMAWPGSSKPLVESNRFCVVSPR